MIKTLKVNGRQFGWAIGCEGNDIVYPRITTIVVKAYEQWNVDGKSKWVLLGSAEVGRHQGYDANRHFKRPSGAELEAMRLINEAAWKEEEPRELRIALLHDSSARRRWSRVAA